MNDVKVLWRKVLEIIYLQFNSLPIVRNAVQEFHFDDKFEGEGDWGQLAFQAFGDKGHWFLHLFFDIPGQQ